MTEEPVHRIEVEHADGTTRVLTGDDAHAWAMYVESLMRWSNQHGGQAPDVDWEERES